MLIIFAIIILLIFVMAFFRGKNTLYWSLGSYLISSSVILISLITYNIIVGYNYTLSGAFFQHFVYSLAFKLKIHVSDVVILYNLGNMFLWMSSVMFLVVSDKKFTFKRGLLFIPPILYFALNHPRVKYRIWNHYLITANINPLSKLALINTILLIAYFLIPFVILARQYFKTRIFSRRKYILSTVMYIFIIELTMALVLHGNSYSNYYPSRFDINSLPIRGVANTGFLHMPMQYVELFLSMAVVILLYIFTYCDFSYTFNFKNSQKKLQRENDEMLQTVFHTYKNAFFAIERFETILENNIDKSSKNSNVIETSLQNIKSISHTYYQNSKKMLNSAILSYDFNRERVRVNLKEMMDSLLLQYEASPNLTIERHFDDEDIFVKLNVSDITEAFTNILNNSVDATQDVENPTIKISIFKEDNYAVINFFDNGCGIEKKEIKNIFRFLYSRKNSSYNFGIGLSYSLKAINYHSGTIQCKSKLNEYTIFQVVLPAIK